MSARTFGRAATHPRGSACLARRTVPRRSRSANQCASPTTVASLPPAGSIRAMTRSRSHTSSARPQTLYALTAEGRTALKLYLERLERLLSFARQGQAEDNDIPADLQHRPAF